MQKKVIVICGPTASGKTDLSIELALQYHCPILSFDSRQIFKELDIGVAKPDAHQLKLVPHHFIGSHSILKEYNAGIFQEESSLLLEQYFQNNNNIIATGGSGLYLKAMEFGFDDFPEIPKKVRLKLNQDLKEKGLAFLQNELSQNDPITFKTIDTKNPIRVIRALEIFRHTRRSFSSLKGKTIQKRPYEFIKFAIDFDRTVLYKRINTRVDAMMEMGLLQECEKLFHLREINALKTVGYKELFEHLEGKTSLEEAIEKIKINTRRYAKRQITWFKNGGPVFWIDGEASTKEKIETILQHTRDT